MEATNLSSVNQTYLNNTSNQANTTAEQPATPAVNEVKDGDKKSMNALKWAGIIGAATLAVGGTIYAIKKGKGIDIEKLDFQDGKAFLKKNGKEFSGKATETIKDESGNVIAILKTRYTKGVAVGDVEKEIVNQELFAKHGLSKMAEAQESPAVSSVLQENFSKLPKEKQEAEITKAFDEAKKINEQLDFSKLPKEKQEAEITKAFDEAKHKNDILNEAIERQNAVKKAQDTADKAQDYYTMQSVGKHPDELGSYSGDAEASASFFEILGVGQSGNIKERCQK